MCNYYHLQTEINIAKHLSTTFHYETNSPCHSLPYYKVLYSTVLTLHAIKLKNFKNKIKYCTVLKLHLKREVYTVLHFGWE